MYSQPTKFTIFYFYFLLVVYGWWSKQTWRCKGCMRGEAWKMFFGNLLFVLGVPVAIVQLLRCYSGSVVGGVFRGLDAANLKARKGDVVGALTGYKAILERVPHSAGIKYNLALALLQQGDERRAAETFELALTDCVNYAPAYRVLSGLYAKLGDQARLKELQEMWGDVEAAEQQQVTADGSEQGT
jgi:tetratricopeptide (TPR) repeat protein